MNYYLITLEDFAEKVNQCLAPEICLASLKKRKHPKFGRKKRNPNVAYLNLSTGYGKRSLHLLAELWHFVR